MSVQGYDYEEGTFAVTPEIKAHFDRRGYILVRKLLSDDELHKVRDHLENNEVIKQYAFEIDDGAGRKYRICLWNHPGDDVTGMVARCEKVVGTCEKLLGGEVYHYHTKLMMKDAFTGGRFMWHQDYGYWYNNTCLFPDTMTVFIALDPCHKGNGCLQILEGSHLCGRIEHKVTAGQMGADPERVTMIQDRCPLVHVEMQPGDALFFHCNLLHTSSENRGPDRRWALLSVYNKASNDPVKKHNRPQYTKLYKVPNSAILGTEVTEWDVSAKWLETQGGHNNTMGKMPEVDAVLRALAQAVKPEMCKMYCFALGMTKTEMDVFAHSGYSSHASFQMLSAARMKYRSDKAFLSHLLNVLETNAERNLAYMVRNLQEHTSSPD